MEKLKYTLRIDKMLFRKFQYVAKEEESSVNREFEYIIKLFVKRFETKNGNINRTYLFERNIHK